MNYKNGREVKVDDKVVGIDWRGGVVYGDVVTGDPKKDHPPFVFRHSLHKTVCPSLGLENFLCVEDAVVSTAGVPSVTAKAPSGAANAIQVAQKIQILVPDGTVATLNSDEAAAGPADTAALQDKPAPTIVEAT